MNAEKFIAALKANRFEVAHFAVKEEAARYLEESIQGKTVGLGDSLTLISMDIETRLAKRNTVHTPAHTDNIGDFLTEAAKCADTQVFLTSVNAAAETGQLINIDGTGNRVSSSLFGHEKVYFVLGANKVMPTLEAAIDRVRNVAAPQNARRHGKKTPCAVRADKCYDCSSPDRICNVLAIHQKKMSNIEMEVVLIDEPLGL